MKIADADNTTLLEFSQDSPQSSGRSSWSAARRLERVIGHTLVACAIRRDRPHVSSQNVWGGEELLSALSLGPDEDEVEVLALFANMQEASSEAEDDSAYRPISLKVARQYMDELKYFFQENRPAMERHVEPAAAMMKDLTAMHISSHSVQSTMHAFFRPAPRPESDSGVCAAGGKAQ